MTVRFRFLVCFYLAAAALPAMQAVAPQKEEVFENDVFDIRQVHPGSETAGAHLLSLVVTNRLTSPQNFVLDIRTEAFGFGLVNWQKQFFFALAPRETRTIEAEYQIATSLLSRTILRFGETPEFESWVRLTPEEKQVKPGPQITWYWRKELPARSNTLSWNTLRDAMAPYSLFLNPTTPEDLARIKQRLPDLIKRSRSGADPVRKRLRELFLATREYPQDYSYRQEAWPNGFSSLNTTFENQKIQAEPFSITADDGVRVSAFVATQMGTAYQKRPMIFLLSGNPPGTKESLAGLAIYFAKLGFHAVAVDRRNSSRTLDTKEKFLTNFSDPVSDLLRLIDFFSDQTKYPFSKIGIFGVSAGAVEGKFAAALDDRISAVVLASGIASNSSLFEDDAWVPTYSGMIIFPELGLGTPDIDKLTADRFFEDLRKVTPEDNARARKIYEETFPYFEDLDALKVTPLIAPVPLLIISGAQDDQFKPSGAAEVDERTLEAYEKFGLPVCSEFYLEPRAGHWVDLRGGYIVTAFFDRWLR